MCPPPYRGPGLASSSESDCNVPITLKPQKRRRKQCLPDDSRYVKRCPVAGCKAGPQVRLALHIQKYHPDITAEDRRSLTRTAEVVRKGRKGRPVPPKGMATIESLFRGQQLQEPLKVATTPRPHRQNTRHLPRFPLTHPEVAPFVSFLEGFDGKRKTVEEARAVATDVSKFLKFTSPEKPNWQDLLVPPKVRSYLDHLKDSGMCGVDGLLTKLQRFEMGIKFVKLELLAEDDQAGYLRCQRATDRYSDWRASLQPEKAVLNAQRLERASNSNKPVTELTALVRHTPLWDDVNDVLARAAVPGQNLTAEEEKLVVAALMGNILQKNFQRPGAAAQATLEEFNNVERVIEGGEEVRVMRVARHKTARKGPAYLTMTANDYKMLKKYVKRVRPRLDPAGQLDLLFIRRGPKQVKDVNALLNFLKGKYGLVIETSTKLRKSGETASFQTLTVKESELVSRHMSHTPQTAARYYQAVVGKREAARAHVLRAKLYEEGNEADNEDTGDDEVDEEDNNEDNEGIDDDGVDEEDNNESNEDTDDDGVDGEEYQELEMEDEKEEIEGDEDEGQEKVTPKKGRSRVEYNSKELGAISRYFHWHINHEKTISLGEARTFLSEHPMDRNEKQIQDKVKQLGKRV